MLAAAMTPAPAYGASSPAGASRGAPRHPSGVAAPPHSRAPQAHLEDVFLFLKKFIIADLQCSELSVFQSLKNIHLFNTP